MEYLLKSDLILQLSDLGVTAKILETTFPNLQYLSLHGNPMCPDNLYLQPFSEFVPYEYTHYRYKCISKWIVLILKMKRFKLSNMNSLPTPFRTILCNSLPHLKFLDHFSLDTFRLPTPTLSQHTNQQNTKEHHQNSTYKDLWLKVKSFITDSSSSSSNSNIRTFAHGPPNECIRHCGNVYIS